MVLLVGQQLHFECFEPEVLGNEMPRMAAVEQLHLGFRWIGQCLEEPAFSVVEWAGRLMHFGRFAKVEPETAMLLLFVAAAAAVSAKALAGIQLIVLRYFVVGVAEHLSSSELFATAEPGNLRPEYAVAAAAVMVAEKPQRHG